MPFKIEKTESEWEALLKEKGAEPLAYRVTRQASTERPFSGKLTLNTTDGTYECICCGKPLFSSETKFESHCGWPSYFQPINEDAIDAQTDVSLSMQRTEVHCSDCGAHLGHVFNDGPAPTGLRYCINSASLHFTPK